MLVSARPSAVSGFTLFLALAVLAPGPSRSAETPSPPDVALNSIKAADLRRHIKMLSSDEFEGRAPGTRGEMLTVEYLVGEFRRLGLQPGNPDGTYVQNVPLTGITSQPEIFVTVDGKNIGLVHKQDYVANTPRPDATVVLRDSALVFVGYGVVAPEYGWDDYKDVDVRGKTVVVLLNDPQIPAADDPGRLDDRSFKGAVKTYYSTLRHKREVAARKGAAAMIVVHEAGHAGWPFDVALSDAGREHLQLDEAVEPRLQANVTMPAGKVRALFKLAGQDLEVLRQRTIRRDFKPSPLGIKANFGFRNTTRKVISRNVVAKVEGSDPKLKDDIIIYTAHWDHLGMDPSLPGDKIYHGALDNASGVAAMLEIAKAFGKLPHAPKRSILFIATTAEEHGLLGAKHYVQHPLYPLSRTMVDLNFDVVGFWPPTRTFEVVGLGETDLDPVLHEVAASLHRKVVPDSSPEFGSSFRQDAAEFVRVGVPGFYLSRSDDTLGFADTNQRAGFVKSSSRRYETDDYHKVSDTMKRDWNFEGVVDFCQFAFALGYRLGQGGPFPQWLPGTEARIKRDVMMQAGPKDAETPR